MSLFKDWEDLIANQTDESFPDFWEKYSSTEKKIYSDILDRPTEKVTGTFQSLVDKYEADPLLVMGFLIVLGTLIMLIIGGVLYSLGVIFYAKKNIRYMHSIWHIFVVGGSVLHWFSVLFAIGL